jgi:hypothetical protein
MKYAIERRPLFSLGKLVATPGALAVFRRQDREHVFHLCPGDRKRKKVSTNMYSAAPQWLHHDKPIRNRNDGGGEHDPGDRAALSRKEEWKTH